jgi:ribonuclease-3
MITQKVSKINPFNNKNKLINKNDIQNVLKRYGIFQNINNLGIYQEAFTHESYSLPHIEKAIDRDNLKLADKLDGVAPLQKKSYERLEYLGDAIIEGIISKYLFERYPEEDESFLSRMRVSLVKGMNLAYLSRVVGFGKNLLISRTLEEKENGRMKESILEDIFEAFIGAIFIDFNNDKHGFLSSFYSGAGYQVAEKFLINLIEDENTKINFVDLILNDGNYKNKLVDYYRRIFRTGITFKTSNIEEENNKKKYYVDVYRNDTNKLISKGIGVDNKTAQHHAAKQCLIMLNLLPSD